MSGLNGSLTGGAIERLTRVGYQGLRGQFGVTRIMVALSLLTLCKMALVRGKGGKAYSKTGGHGYVRALNSRAWGFWK